MPPPGGTYDQQHSFILQMITQNNSAIAALMSKVERLIDDVADQGKELNDLSRQATYIKGWLAGSIVIIGLIVAIGAFVIDHSWDDISNKLTQYTQQETLKNGAFLGSKIEPIE